MAVPNIFATATTTIPLSQLDANFATAITLGNTAVYLGNTTTSLGNLTLTNVTISSVASAITVAQGGTGLTSGTSGGVPYFSSTSAMTSSAALAANALVIGGGAGAAPATTTTGTGVVTALGVNVGTAGAFVVNGGALGTPSSGTVTNLTGTASININGTVGATTTNTGAFTTLSASGLTTVTGAGIQAQAAAGQAKSSTGAFNSGSAAASSAEIMTYAQAGTQKISHFWANNLSRYQIQTLTSGHTISLAPDTGATDVLVAKAAGVDVTGTLSSTGALTVGGSLGATVDIFEAISASGTKFIGEFKNTNASSPNGISIYYSVGSPNGTANEFLYLTDTGGLRMSTRSNGGIANYQANNANLSDISVKTDFQQHDIAKAWDFGKRMRDAWGRFKYEDQTHDDWNSGYGAQLVQVAAGEDFPELVELTKWGERDLLTVYDSDLMHIMGAVTTELQYRSDDYESRIAALEAQLKATAALT